jgi:hypothetical protein
MINLLGWCQTVLIISFFSTNSQLAHAVFLKEGKQKLYCVQNRLSVRLFGSYINQVISCMLLNFRCYKAYIADLMQVD